MKIKSKMKLKKK